MKAQQPETKISRNKQKRLDKYVDLKIKKDESAALLKKLEGTKVDTSLLRSMKVLGQGGGGGSRREGLQRALREQRAGLDLEGNERVLFERRGGSSSGSGDEDGEEVDIPSIPMKVERLWKKKARKAAVEEKTETKDVRDIKTEEAATSVNVSKSFDSISSQPPTIDKSFGSGLKRPLEVDDSGFPILPKRIKKGTNNFKFAIPPPGLVFAKDNDEETEWGGFSDIGNTDEESEPSDDSNEDGNSSAGENDEEGSEEEGSEDEDASDSDEDSNIDPTEDREARKHESRARMSAFKSWAEQERNKTVDFTPSNALTDTLTIQSYIDYTPRPVEQDPIPQELQIQSDLQRKAYAVKVERAEEIQHVRLNLPVVAKEQEIMEAIFHHDTVIISGATGSGKTTQIPQFLFENGFGDSKGPTPGMIGVTQPRRVAAVSMAKRVGDELGASKDRVAHQIRFDTTVSSKTAIKFMTDGVLLREMANDFALRKYSAIVIDEAHERTVNTDILISLMSRCVKARAELARDKPKLYTPLKLIIMSATLRVSDFRENQRLFINPPPLVQAEGRQFEVTPHWARRTTHDFIEDAFRKVRRGHRQLPPGGILVFLTGQNDIKMISRKLKEVFPATEPSSDSHIQVRIDASEMVVEEEDLHSTEHINNVTFENESDDDSEVEFEGLDDKDPDFEIENEKPGDLLKVHILPLYSQLPSKAQFRVFENVPEGSRLIVLATNVAETSLTIPGIRYVFDSGRVKERTWDQAGVQTFQTTWVSKASADQRMGRAGRTGPGHCYRLYSSAIYETFKDFAEPEIYRSPLEGVVLQLKALNIARIDNFPFPTPPDRSSLVKAESLLCHLGALDSNRRITPLGRELHKYPLSPRFAQMLRLGVIHGMVDHAIAMVAALDVAEVFIPDHQLDLRTPEKQESEVWSAADEETETRRTARAKAHTSAHVKMSRLSPTSDAIKLLSAIMTYSQAEDSEAVCEEYFLRAKALKEADQLREQLNGIVKNLHGNVQKLAFAPGLSVPSDKEVNVLRQIVAAGFVDQVAIRADLLPNPPTLERKPKRAIDVRYQTLIPSYDHSTIQSDDEKFVYLHPSSVLAHKNPSKLPSYIIYHRLQRSQTSRPDIIPKIRMLPLTPVSAEQLATLTKATDLLDVSKPRGKITVVPSSDGKERRQCHVDLGLAGRKGDLGWTLVRKEVIQRREPGEGWVVEKFVG